MYMDVMLCIAHSSPDPAPTVAICKSGCCLNLTRTQTSCLAGQLRKPAGRLG